MSKISHIISVPSKCISHLRNLNVSIKVSQVCQHIMLLFSQVKHVGLIIIHSCRDQWFTSKNSSSFTDINTLLHQYSLEVVRKQFNPLSINNAYFDNSLKDNLTFLSNTNLTGHIGLCNFVREPPYTTKEFYKLLIR